MKINFIGFFLVLMCFSACGIKGPPLAPIEEETIQKQMAEAQTASTDRTVPANQRNK